MMTDEDFAAIELAGKDALHEVAKPRRIWGQFLEGNTTVKDKRQAVVKLIDATTAGLILLATDFTAKVQSGIATLAGWAKSFFRMVGAGNVAIGMAATGTVDLAPADRETVKAIVAKQLEYAEGFRDDLATAALLLLAPKLAGALSSTLRDPSPKFLRRSGMYGQALWGTAQAVLRAKAHRDGYDEERRFLGESGDHCEDCPGYAARGWVRVDDPDPLPAIGESECMIACRCHFEYRRSGTNVVVVPLEFHDRPKV